MVRMFAALAGRNGIDEAWARLTPAQAQAAGLSFVVGYVSEDTSGKNLTKAEALGYLADGVGVLLVYEYATDAVSGGTARGARDAGIGVAQARAVGYPQGCVLAFAVDEDTSGNPAQVDSYARAFTAVCHTAGYRSMDYGGYATVKRCADLELTDLHWQTYGWSTVNGRLTWDPRVAIRQTQNGVNINGRDVDRDVAMVDDIGAWLPNGGGVFVALSDAQQTEMFGEVQHLARQMDAFRQGSNKTADGQNVVPVDQLKQLVTGQAATQAQVTALTAAVAKLASGGTSVDTAAVIAHIDQVSATESAAVKALQEELDQLRAAQAAAAQAEADALKS